MNLCLGTVQFGMDYGIGGQKRPLIQDSIKMLDYAFQKGIYAFDTANVYGIAEEVIGLWLSKDSGVRKRIKLISKSLPNLFRGLSEEHYYNKLKENLHLSLERLGSGYLDVFMLHDAKYVYYDAVIEAMARLKKDGYIRETGVSVYEVDEAKHGVVHPKIDILQLPYSVLDQRMLHGGVFELAVNHDCVLHARSVFLQGLILMDEHNVPHFLHRAVPILREIDIICKNNGISRVQLAMGFVKRQDAISHLVFGVDNMEQLREKIDLFQQDIEPAIVDEASIRFKDLDAELIMPNLWKR